MHTLDLLETLYESYKWLISLSLWMGLTVNPLSSEASDKGLCDTWMQFEPGVMRLNTWCEGTSRQRNAGLPFVCEQALWNNIGYVAKKPKYGPVQGYKSWEEKVDSSWGCNPKLCPPSQHCGGCDCGDLQPEWGTKLAFHTLITCCSAQLLQHDAAMDIA